MSGSLRALVALGILGVGCAQASAQETLAYRDRTGGREIDILMSEELLSGGSIIHSRMSDGDSHDSQLDASAANTSYHVESPARRIAYTVTRAGNLLRFSGVFAGSPLAKTITIGNQPWYQAVERSFRDWVRAGAPGSVDFWVVHPWEANAYLLSARAEGQELITVNGRQVTGLRIRVGPPGILRIFWSSLYWYRPSDGAFLRYEAVRGFPGTPLTVVELMGNG